MQVVHVVVARLVNTGDYENTRFELGAALALGDIEDDVAAALSDQLRTIIAAELRRRFPSADDRRWKHWLERGEDPELDAERDTPSRPLAGG